MILPCYACSPIMNHAEKDAVRWCHLKHQFIAGQGESTSVIGVNLKLELRRSTDILFQRDL